MGIHEIVQSDENIHFLHKIDLFQDVPSYRLEEVAQHISKKVYQKGQIVVMESDEAKGVFFVNSGIVKLTKQDHEGNELIVCMRKKGEIFAEASLFSTGQVTYPATATMVMEGELSFLSNASLEKCLYGSPELAIAMIRYMSIQLRDHTSTMRDIALLDVYTNTVKTLEKLALKFGEIKCDNTIIEMPITVQEFASLIGTSRESVSRVFSRLKKEKIIDIRQKKIIILDYCKFHKLSHPHPF